MDKNKRLQIARCVRGIRSAANMTQENFARKFGIPLSTYQHWESGNSIPPIYVLTLIVTVLHLSNKIDFETYQDLYFKCNER